MVLGMEKPKNRKSTKKPGMRGRDAARKLTLKVDILQVFTIDFSEIQFIVKHNSQSDGQNKSAKRWTNLPKIVYTASQANKLKNLSIQKNINFGIPLQAHRSGTRIGNEL